MVVEERLRNKKKKRYPREIGEERLCGVHTRKRGVYTLSIIQKKKQKTKREKIYTIAASFAHHLQRIETNDGEAGEDHGVRRHPTRPTHTSVVPHITIVRGTHHNTQWLENL